MLPWWIWVVAAAAVLVVAGLVAVCAVVVGAQSEERRGGLLELDTWEARNALTLFGDDLGEAAMATRKLAGEARFVEVYGRRRRVVRRWEDGSVTTLLGCGHTAVNDAPVVCFHGREFCSFECVNASIARASSADDPPSSRFRSDVHGDAA